MNSGKQRSHTSISGLVVEFELPKLETRVRFPAGAYAIESAKLHVRDIGQIGLNKKGKSKKTVGCFQVRFPAGAYAIESAKLHVRDIGQIDLNKKGKSKKTVGCFQVRFPAGA